MLCLPLSIHSCLTAKYLALLTATFDRVVLLYQTNEILLLQRQSKTKFYQIGKNSHLHKIHLFLIGFMQASKVSLIYTR